MVYHQLCIIAQYTPQLAKAFDRKLPALYPYLFTFPSTAMQSATNPSVDLRLLLSANLEDDEEEVGIQFMGDKKDTRERPFALPKHSSIARFFWITLHDISKETRQSISLYKLSTFGGDIVEEWSWTSDGEHVTVREKYDFDASDYAGDILMDTVREHGVEMKALVFEPFAREFDWREYGLDK